jgi:hypothetical protein
MNIERTLLLHAIVMATLITLCIHLTYGKDSPSIVYIVRNVAWNDFIAQIVCTTNLHKILSAKKCGLSKSFSKRMKPK